MRARSSPVAFFTTRIAALWLLACASPSENGPTILEGMGSAASGEASVHAASQPAAFDTEGPIRLPYRAPDAGGIAYRLTFEVEGQRAAHSSTTQTQQPSIHETQTLQVDFRALPIDSSGSHSDGFRIGLDALRFTEKQQSPPLDRDIEIADDRLRISVDGKTSIDNRGNRVTGTLAPRIFLGRIIGVITHDVSGNPTRLSPRGSPTARQFMEGFPTLGAIAYAMIAFPEEPISAGSRWSGIRIPPSRSGELGLGLTIDYSLTGFETFEGVACALIVLSARVDGRDVKSVTGHLFDRVSATLNGTAWVELENSLVRRVVLSDRIDASWTDSRGSVGTVEHRIEHASKLLLVLRDPDENPKHWSDGTVQFNSH